MYTWTEMTEVIWHCIHNWVEEIIEVVLYYIHSWTELSGVILRCIHNWTQLRVKRGGMVVHT